MKHPFIIVGSLGIVVVLGAALWVYFMLFYTHTAPAHTAPNPFSEASSSKGFDAIAQEQAAQSSTTAPAVPATGARLLTLRKTIGAVALADGTYRFVEAGTGHVYQIDSAGLETKLSGTTFPGARRAVWSHEGTRVAITRETEGGSLETFNGVLGKDDTGVMSLDGTALQDAAENVSYSASGDTLGSRVGPFRALNSNGQSLSLSDHLGRFGYFLSGSRQENDRRIDQPSPALYHDHGFDYFLYGKMDYILSEADYLTMNLNYGKTYTQIPFDSSNISDDIQETSNAFQTLSYFHTISTEADAEKNIFVGGYAREGGLIFTPGLTDAPAFVFPSGDSTHPYNLMEDRKFTTVGIRTKYDARLSHEFQYAVGLTLSNTTGSEHFTSTDSVGKAGPEVLTNFVGSDFGAFAQIEVHPLEWMRLDLGMRYDQHIAPDLPLQEHWSPRAKWTFLIDPFTSAYLYYGKVFMPTNIEGLRSIAAGNNTTATGTAAEKDDIYEAGVTHTFDFGLTSKLAYFRKESAPGLDDQTVGSSAIKTPVNIAQVHTAGLEVALTYSNPVTPFSGYLNASIIHSYGSGAITGGFLNVSDAGVATDLDHDQRLSIVASLNYQPSDWFANVVGTYGSGLTNGNPSGSPYAIGLFDFNQFAHTTPSWIFNVGGGYTIHLPGNVTMEPSLYVTNIFNHLHLLKGAFFSGASWEEPRNVTLKLAVHL